MTDPVEQIVAGAKLQELLETPDQKIEIMPDNAGVKIGDNRSFWQRVKDSWVNRLHSVLGFLSLMWLGVPQDQVAAVVPLVIDAKYVAIGLLIISILTFLARTRSL